MPTPQVGLSQNPRDLSMIHDEGFVAAIWHRKPLPSFQSWIDELDPGCLPKARVILPVDNVHDTVKQVCDVFGTPDCPERQILEDDVSALATIFSDITKASHILLWFDVIAKNSVQSFHNDTDNPRLVCTYRGAGMHYGISTDGKEPKNIFSVPTGSAMLLRGADYPKGAKSELLYRSPPIESTNDTRLLLVLDPVIGNSIRPARNTLH
ncbi:MAG: DUF1826 domain-containing protein [Pseudomonadota bacterium]